MNTDTEFLDKTDLVEEELAKILGKVCHHIHPQIIEKIVKQNEIEKDLFTKNCIKMPTDYFFFPGSDCVFPGVRRHINKEKEGTWKNQINQKDGTIINDNTFPRHVYTYLILNRSYSGGKNGTWSRSKLDVFELAHIFGHKVDEQDLEHEAFYTVRKNRIPYSLFTSASNVVLIPKGIAKPTDSMKSIKLCFYKRHLDLYGNNLNGLEEFNESIIPEWYKNIEWMDPILPMNWEENIENLMKYRTQYLIRKYSV